MKSWKRMALFAAVLGSLGTFGAVGAATLGGGEAAAIPCCDRGCSYGEDRCASQCAPEDDACTQRCFERYIPCYANCEISC